MVGTSPLYQCTSVTTPGVYMRCEEAKNKTFMSDKETGGLKDLDIVAELTSLKFLWIKKLLDSGNFHPWKVAAEQLLYKVGGIAIFHTNLQLSDPYKIQIKKIPNQNSMLIIKCPYYLNHCGTIVK